MDLIQTFCIFEPLKEQMKLTDTYENICCIYLIENRITGRGYVGATTNLRQRIYSHYTGLKNKTHDCFRLQVEYNYYGKDAYEVSILKAFEKRQRRKTLSKYERIEISKRKNLHNKSGNKFFNPSDPVNVLAKKIEIKRNEIGYFNVHEKIGYITTTND